MPRQLLNGPDQASSNGSGLSEFRLRRLADQILEPRRNRRGRKDGEMHEDTRVSATGCEALPRSEQPVRRH